MRTRGLLLASTAALPLLSSAPALSEDYIVDSVAAANRITAKPGDRILFRAGGTYRGELKLRGNGTASAPITIGAYGDGPKPIIDNRGGGAGVNLDGRGGITVRDLDIRGGRYGVYALQKSGNGDHVKILGNDISTDDDGTWGVYVRTHEGGTRRDIEISGNRIAPGNARNPRGTARQNSYVESKQWGIYAETPKPGNIRNLVIKDNTITAAGEDAIRCERCQGFVIAGNRGGGNGENFIDVEESQDGIIQGNYTKGDLHYGMIVHEGNSPQWAARNIKILGNVIEDAGQVGKTGGKYVQGLSVWGLDGGEIAGNQVTAHGQELFFRDLSGVRVGENSAGAIDPSVLGDTGDAAAWLASLAQGGGVEMGIKNFAQAAATALPILAGSAEGQPAHAFVDGLLGGGGGGGGCGDDGGGFLEGFGNIIGGVIGRPGLGSQVMGAAEAVTDTVSGALGGGAGGGGPTPLCETEPFRVQDVLERSIEASTYETEQGGAMLGRALEQLGAVEGVGWGEGADAAFGEVWPTAFEAVEGMDATVDELRASQRAEQEAAARASVAMSSAVVESFAELESTLGEISSASQAAPGQTAAIQVATQAELVQAGQIGQLTAVTAAAHRAAEAERNRRLTEEALMEAQREQDFRVRPETAGAAVTN